jgi:hypothetical protein
MIHRISANTGAIPLRGKMWWPWLVVLSLLWLVAGVSPAFAYRPFDLTDTDVAADGKFELELGIGHLRKGPDKFPIAPDVVGNLGIAGGREIVLEGKLGTPLHNTGNSQAFDFCVRAARFDGQGIYEVRAGLTWGFAVGNNK